MLNLFSLGTHRRAGANSNPLAATPACEYAAATPKTAGHSPASAAPAGNPADAAKHPSSSAANRSAAARAAGTLQTHPNRPGHAG
jgi:hypothetical protein